MPGSFDEELLEKIHERLSEDPTINADDIEVRVENGHVGLHGHVESRDDRKWVEALVRQVPEVEDVTNLLLIEPEVRREDPDLDRPSL